MSGDVHVRFCEGPGVRFPGATHLVLIFSDREDAHRVKSVLPHRFGKYGLSLHPEKTRLVNFVRPGGNRGTAQTFDFLGFTHYWAKSRKGRWVPKHRTAKDRLKRTAKRIAQRCRQRRHSPVSVQATHLGRMLRGHYQYFGVTGNAWSLWKVYRLAQWMWFKWLSRRSQRARLSWEAFKQLLKRHPLPPPRAYRSTYRLAKP